MALFSAQRPWRLGYLQRARQMADRRAARWAQRDRAAQECAALGHRKRSAGCDTQKSEPSGGQSRQLLGCVRSQNTQTFEFAGTVADYYKVVKVAYIAAHAVDPQVVIHLAGLTYFQDVVYSR